MARETTNDGKNSSVWSVEEDAELARLQEICGNRWALVAAELPGKTGQQCAQRWRHKVNPSIKKEKWTPEEDAQLAHLYLAHGQRWAEIARHLEGRTDQQCMGRWRRHLDPSVKKDAWAVGEDETLMRLHDSLGPRWSNISKMLTGRTAQQCRARWFQLSAVEDDGAQSTEGSDSETDGATVVVVTTRDDDVYKPRGKYASENLSPSTPSVTDEHGTVTISFGASMKPETSRKRNGVGAVSEKGAWNVGVKRARKTVTKDAAGGSGDTNENSPEDFSGHGQGSGLDMLAMLYSAAVSYEQAMGAASAGVPLATHSEELTTHQTNAALTHPELHA